MHIEGKYLKLNTARFIYVQHSHTSTSVAMVLLLSNEQRHLAMEMYVASLASNHSQYIVFFMIAAIPVQLNSIH